MLFETRMRWVGCVLCQKFLFTPTPLPRATQEGCAEWTRSKESSSPQMPQDSLFKIPTKCPCSAPGDILILQVKGLSFPEPLPHPPHTPPKKPGLRLRCH